MMRSFNRTFALFLLLGTLTGCVANEATAQAEIGDEIIEKIKAALPEKPPVEPKAKRRVLIFTKTNGYRHASIPIAVKCLTMLGEKTGAFEAFHSEDDSMFDPDQLKEFDAVFMINTTGDIFLPHDLPSDPEAQVKARDRESRLKQSLVEFVSSGKGLCGIHSATDTYKDWKEFNEMMGGAFVSHPWHEAVPVRVLDADHPLNKVFHGEGFTITDEIYQFRNDTAQSDSRRMLLTIKPGWEGLSKGQRDDNVWPISWIDTYEKGRIFYCSLGHRDEIFYNPVILEHYLAGFQFALGDLEADATPKKISD